MCDFFIFLFSKCVGLLGKHFIFYTSAATVTEGMPKGPPGPLSVPTIFFCMNFYPIVRKLDLKVSSYLKTRRGLGPVDNRPSTDKLYHFVQKKFLKNVTGDTWHVTCDTWHVTCETWHVWGGGWTFSQNFSSPALTVCDLWYYEDLEEKDDSLN